MDGLDDLLFGAELSDVIGKELDVFKPIRIIAYVLIVCLLGNMFLSMFIEEYRLQALMQESRGISLNAIQCAVEELQNIGEDDMSYLFDSSGNLTVEYQTYLQNLNDLAVSTGDVEMLNVVNLLKFGDMNGELYTPLSFNLTFLDRNELERLVDQNLRDMFDASNSTEFKRGSINNGSIMESLIIGSERMEYTSCDVSVEGMRVIDITDVSSCSDEEKALYRAVYGTESQEASKLDGLGLTERHYLIVYQVRYVVKWTPFTRTWFFRNKASSSKINSDGFLALPEITDEYTELYYITN